METSFSSLKYFCRPQPASLLTSMIRTSVEFILKDPGFSPPTWVRLISKTVVCSHPVSVLCFFLCVLMLPFSDVNQQNILISDPIPMWAVGCHMVALNFQEVRPINQLAPLRHLHWWLKMPEKMSIYSIPFTMTMRWMILSSSILKGSYHKKKIIAQTSYFGW